MLLSAGFVSGLGAATRYPAGIIVVIPSLYLLLNRQGDSEDRDKGFLGRFQAFVAGPLWLIAFGFVAGLFIGHPEFFLNFRGVIDAIAGETLKYASLQEFNTDKLFNFSVIWKYISHLIPFAMYPFLWLVPYCAILYLGFRRNLYSQSVPILIFSLLYLYFMAKGYLGPYFARATMLLFPGFCVLVGIAYNDLWSRLSKQRTVAVLLSSAFVLLVGPSVVFDLAYVHAMRKKDARLVLRYDLEKMIGESPAIIGVSRFGPYFYTVMPAAEPLESDKVIVQLQDPGQKADFFLIGFTGPIDPARLNATVRTVEAQGRFSYEKGYSVRPKLFGRELRLARFPSDMTYPFPTILLFRGKTET